MLRLSLLRHAKSSWDDASLDDYDRPLNARGRAAAPRMGRHLHRSWLETRLPPDLVLCSTATRARETWMLAAAEIAPPPPVTYVEWLYLAGADAVLERLRQLPRGVRHAMVVGHNPDLQELAMLLIARGDREEVAALRAKLPTCGLVVLDIPAGSWKQIRGATAELAAFVTPRRLDDGPVTEDGP